MAWHSEGHRPSSRDMLAELEAAEIRRRAAERNACDDIASGEVWPADCSRCGAPRTDWEAKTWPDICSDCA